MIIKFYDTSSLLLKATNLFEDKEFFAISSITLQELEDIKTSNHKSPDIKYAARRLLATLDSLERGKDYEVIIFKTKMVKPIIKAELEVTNDTKILACAIEYDIINPDVVEFVTNDLALKNIANLFFGNDSISSVEVNQDNYTGYLDLTFTNEELAELYSTNIVPEPIKVNQYLIIRNQKGEIIDKMKWNGERLIPISFGNFKSYQFGDVKPFKDDPYQALLVDSLINNKITLVKGRAGSGKSYLSLAYLFNQLEKHKIDKIIVFCNTVAAKNAARLGWISLK